MDLTTLCRHLQPMPGFIYTRSNLVILDGKVSHIDVHLQRDGRCKRGLCSGCGKPAPGYDTLPQRQWRHVPLWNVPVWLHYAPKRVQCPECGVKVAAVPWSDGKHMATKAMILFLACWAKLLSWKQVATSFQTSWDMVYRSVQSVVDYGLKNRVLGAIEALGVDEIHWRKGKKGNSFVTLIYQVDGHCRRLLWVGLNRTRKTLREGLNSLGQEVLGGIKVVCSDMCKAYLQEIRAKLPNALNILDKFHIVQHLNKAVDENRRREVASLRKAKQSERAQALKRSRWSLLVGPKKRKGKILDKLNDVICATGPTTEAWQLREIFAPFWNYKSVHWALAYLDAWTTHVLTKTQNEPMQRVAKMLNSHRELLGNYFRAKKQYTSAAVEGMNLKCGLVKRRAYGLRTFDALQTALYHNLGHLPEPPTTHRFC